METADTATTVETGEGLTKPVQTTTAPSEPFVVGAKSVYPDVASLFEGAKQKEAFIDKLLGEKRALEEQLKALQNINKFQEEISNMTEQQPTVTEPTSQITEAMVQEFALKALQQQRKEELTASNLSQVNEVMSKVFGAEADNKLEAKCKELGISKEFGMSIAKDSPKAFLKMLGLEAPAQVSVDSLISKGHMTQAAAQTTQVEDPLSNMIKNPSLAQNRNYLQGLFKEAMQHPEKVMYSDTEWTALGK